MTKLLEIKALLVGYYKEYEKVINPAFKFIFLLLSLLKLNSYLGYVGILDKFVVNVAIAAVATFIPGSWFIAILMGIVGFQFYSAGFLEAAIVIMLAMVVVYLLFVRLFPKMAYFVVLVPLLYSLKLIYVVPIVAGLFFGPTTVVAIGTGVLVYRATAYIPNLLTMTSATLYDIPDTLVSMYKYLLDALINDKELVLIVFVFAAVVVVTYIVSQFEFDYVWYIAIAAGGVINILGFLIGGVILDVSVGFGGILFGTILAMIISAIIQFMRFSLDYTRKERVQFEDEDYYYYVKAIPKIKVSKSEKEVKTIR